MERNHRVCKYCGQISDPGANQCAHCGRYFVVLSKNPASGDLADGLKNPAVISSLVLFVSLFLPWFSAFILKLSAFDVAKFFRMTSRLAQQSDAVMTLIHIMIYAIPIGCVMVIILVFRNGAIRTVGSITGSLPVVILFLLLVRATGILRAMGIGFFVAIVSGITLVYFSRKE